MLRALVFNQRSWDTRSALRYYVPGYHTASATQSNATTTTVQQENHTPPIFEMLSTIRQTALPARSRLPTHGFPPNNDFIPLPNYNDSDIEEDVHYTIDAEPQEFINNTPPTYVCLMHVELGLSTESANK